MLLVGTDERLIALERVGSGWSQAWTALEGYSLSGLARDPTRPGHLLASDYRQGVFLSTDGGQTWRQVLVHNAWAIAVSPDGTAYAGIKPAAVARSRDGGESWEDLTQRVAKLPTYSQWDAPFPPYTAHVRTLAVRPGDPQVVYGGVEVGGVIVSRDGGDSWQELRNGVHLDVHGLAAAPSDPWVIYAATGGGFYRSFDAGETWEPAQRGMHHRYNMAVAVHPLEPRTVVTATMAGPPPAWSGPKGADATIYRSRDGGDTWEPLARGLPATIRGGVYALAMGTDQPGPVFAALSTGEVWASDDLGESWQRVAQGLPPAHTLLVL